MAKTPLPRPPALAELLARWVVPRGEFGSALVGDLHEEFSALAERRSVAHARLWYRYQVWSLMGRYAVRRLTPSWGRRRRIRWTARGGNSGGDIMAPLIRDTRYAVRALVRRPAFTATVVVTLGLGIGANTAIFSVVYGVLLRPLPYSQPERLVSVWGRFVPESGFDFPQFPLSEPEYIDYRDESESMEAVALYADYGASLTDGAGDPERVRAAAVSSNLFQLLRVMPELGRGFTREDDLPTADLYVVLSHAVWQRRFGADSGVIGRTVSINGTPAEVVGVLPPRLAFPTPGTELWTNYRLDEANPGDRQSHNQQAIGRLNAGTTLAQAQAEMAVLMERWKAEFPDIHTGHFLFLRSLLDDVVGDVRTGLVLLLGAVAFVLLIVCVNVANLLLARGENRRREIAVCRALGASRWRILQQLMTESVVLSLLGGVLGLALAIAGTHALIARDAATIPRAQDIGVYPAVLAFAAGLALLTSVLFGLVPAVRSASPDLQGTFRDGGRTLTAGAARLRFRNGLVVAEIALSVLLVIGAGLTMRSFWRLLREDPGFRSDHLLVAQLSLPIGYTAERASAFYTTLLGEVNAIPGVISASAVSNLPIMHSRGVNDFLIEGRPPPADGEMAWNAAFTSPRVGYFETMNIPLLRGRVFDEGDNLTGMPVAMVNETLARRFFPDGDALGRRIRMAGGGDDALWRTIVGIVGDVKYEGVNVDPRPLYYFPNEQALQDFPYMTRFMALTVRTADDPMGLAPQLRAAVHAQDPTLPIVGLQSMDDLLHGSLAQPRLVMMLLAVFGALALVLSAVGIYGVMSYGVAQRTNEIGIRIALGAESGKVTGMVMWQGMRVAAIGVALGVFAARGLTKLMQSQLFEVSATDPITFTGVAVLLAGVALLACYVPARRASRIDPIDALRTE
jgi:putative ABC transport system permease protein